ncbi:hypothetical protein CKO12_13975 [Chromatium okenii]|uniref:Uma2 family endonuclease n=1 Tax=Chromatium okenii TaxID=61644 RepID=UPI0019076C08|nr:Uma2 family endonuclease [Chromatium okenii]MBK1642956.1 hypothetical protein [Chromatium okenii]
MHWQEVCEHPLFQDIPFKVETNRWGQVVMSPATNRHGLYQARLIRWLAQLLPDGEPLAECSIQTPDGVKVADVVWGSSAFFIRNGLANPYLEAPEIVIEILSPSNTSGEMNEKKRLYFAGGAQEFWLCAANGQLRFFSQDDELVCSQLAPEFPQSINASTGSSLM